MKPENSITRRRTEIAEAYSRIMTGEPHEDELILWWTDQVHELLLLEQERAMQNSEPIARLVKNTATEEDLATMHVASFPKNLPEDVRQAAVSHIARILV